MGSTSIVLITGTDTAVGKTWVGRALAIALCQLGYKVLAIKPLETGCPDVPSEAEDGVTLALATGQRKPAQALCRFREPVAPPEAADREKRVINFDEIVRCILEHASHSDITLVEGAGGLLSPLTWDRSAVDLAQVLQARVLLVASDRLGTINHTLMALNILELNRLPVLGVVLTTPECRDASTGSNALAIARLTRCPRIYTVPRGDPCSMAKLMQVVINWLDIPSGNADR